MAANSRFAMATHIMTAVALHSEDDLMNSTELADTLNTNPVVVRRILSDLQKAGLVATQAGRSGGAWLARKADTITLHEIFSAVDDGELFAYNPNDPNKGCSLSCEMKAVLAPIFEAANSALAGALGEVRLSYLTDKLAKKCSAKKK